MNIEKETFSPDEIIYVVDTRQSEHFEKFFAMAAPLGMQDVRLIHVNFGTVLGPDGRPMKTRSGSLIGLESLLDDAVAAARAVVCNPDRLGNMDPPMLEDEQKNISEVVGIGAIKYADLSHHRASDYRFDVNKNGRIGGQYGHLRSVFLRPNACKFCERQLWNSIPATLRQRWKRARPQRV